MGTPQRGVRWPLVGRKVEMATLVRSLTDRRGGGCVISGPAGVGKSRLAEECLARAVRAGFRGGRATASAAAATVPLGAIAHLIPGGVDLSDPVQGFAAIAAALDEQDERPWAILVDDLQLLDASSALLLQHLVDSGVVRLIGTLRTGEYLADSVQSLISAKGVHHIALSEFSHNQVEELLRAALGGPIDRRSLSELVNVSGGNVLYLRELVLGALDSGSLVSDGEVWRLAKKWVPSSRLGELIGARLASAGPQGHQVLRLLALCAPLPLADAIAVSSAEIVQDLEHAGLIQTLRDGRRTLAQLAHPLYGEVLRSDIQLLSRRGILLEQAQRVEARGARRRDDALHIATWRLAATGTADAALLMQAAVLARHARDYARATALLQALPEAEHTAKSLLLFGESLFELGDPRQAEEKLIRAEAAAKTDEEKLEVTFTRTMSLFWAEGRTEDAFAVNKAAEAHLSRDAERRMLRINEGLMRTIAGDPKRGLELLSELDEHPTQAQNIGIWLMGAMMRPVAMAVSGQIDEAVEAAERAYALHCELDEKALVLPPAGHLISLVLALSEAGRLSDAVRIGRNAWGQLEEMQDPDPVSLIWLSYHQGRAEWLSGHVESARRWFAQSAAQSRAHDNHRGLRLSLSGLAASAALLGDTDTAERVEREARNYPPMGYCSGEERLGEAWLLATRGHLADARLLLKEAADAAWDAGYATSAAMLLSDIARLGGAKEVAGQLARLAASSDGQFIPARARLAAALAGDDPEELFAVAEALQELGADLLAAEAATAAGVAWRRAGQARRAEAAARHAANSAAECQGARTPLLITGQTAALLTSREAEIALLAATRQASREIADKLGLSVRTVDNHLQRIYHKLGVNTRRELASILGIKGA
ncbi:LuxR C-terminal-related transcriptional regulator [Streptomyces chryseus]